MFLHHWCIRTQEDDAPGKSESPLSSSITGLCLLVFRRTPFTEEDEERLCQWIATKIPYKETGGRTGNRLYQQLCEMVSPPKIHKLYGFLTQCSKVVDPEYAWVTRHTWQSWRERYKKNSVRLDNLIAAIVDQKKPAHGEKGQYGYVRQAEEKTRRTRKRRAKTIEESFHAGRGEEEKARCTEGDTDTTVPIIMFTPNQVSNKPQVPVSGIHARRSPDEEEMDGEESEDWHIRVGNQSPPPWGKRKAGDDGSHEQHAAKKTKSM